MVAILIILSSVFYFTSLDESDTQSSGEYSLQPTVYVQGGNYIIPIPDSSRFGVPIWSHMAIIKDSDGNDVFGGLLGQFVCLDSRFLDENFSQANPTIIYHKNDLSWSVQGGDVFEIISKANGGRAENNYSLTLRYMHTGDPYDVFRVNLTDDAPTSTLDLDSSGSSNSLSVKRSSESAGQNISVSHNHVPFSRYSTVTQYGIGIGITIINNGSNNVENITIQWNDTFNNPYTSDENSITKEMHNVTIPIILANSSARETFSYIFSSSGPHMVEANVSEGGENIITASTSIEIMAALYE